METFYYPVRTTQGFTVASQASPEAHGSFTSGAAAQRYADLLNAGHAWTRALSTRGNKQASRLGH
jgi:hypothetical protein